jgi:hypothetical protein
MVEIGPGGFTLALNPSPIEGEGKRKDGIFRGWLAMTIGIDYAL